MVACRAARPGGVQGLSPKGSAPVDGGTAGGTAGRGKPGRAGPCGRWPCVGTPRSGQPGVPVAQERQTAPVICPQGAKLLRLEKEIGRASGLEMESKEKDAAIRDLQEEIAAMAKTLARAAARNEVELSQKLLAFDRELGAKREEIEALREQVPNASTGTEQGKYPCDADVF